MKLSYFLKLKDEGFIERIIVSLDNEDQLAADLQGKGNKALIHVLFTPPSYQEEDSDYECLSDESGTPYKFDSIEGLFTFISKELKLEKNSHLVKDIFSSQRKSDVIKQIEKNPPPQRSDEDDPFAYYMGKMNELVTEDNKEQEHSYEEQIKLLAEV